ncbi:MAG: hypothetical protein Fur0046_39230 [Cyanobacteria bacterium J069]|nr:MAG: DUF86 domain-containing protein [Cyanobacteria bacterium J069]
MSSRAWDLRIQDILGAIASIQRCTAGMTLDALINNKTAAKAVLYNFLIIGEASANVPLDLQARYPDIPWRLMQDMRNVMAHEYFQVDVERVWQTIVEDLPPLVPQLQAILEQERAG